MTAADPEQYPGFFLQLRRKFSRCFAVTRVCKSIACGNQTEELRGIRDLQNIGRQTEFHGVEINLGHKTAALTVGLVGRGHVGVIVVFDTPPVGGHVFYAVAALDDIRPKLFDVFRIGKDGRETDDGDGSLLERGIDVHNFLVVGCRLSVICCPSGKGY